MIPGLANILTCPFCGGEKEVMSLVSGNTCGATLWSDTRRIYPMLPEVSVVQKCPHCDKYYFLEEAESHYSTDPESEMRSFGQLGELSFAQLCEAKRQRESGSLSKRHRWMLNRQIIMAYNDTYRRDPEKSATRPANEEELIFRQTIAELLNDIPPGSEYDLFHAELLRESGDFKKAEEILSHHDSDDDRWVVEAMRRHIEKEDTYPFLLIDDGNQVEDGNQVDDSNQVE